MWRVVWRFEYGLWVRFSVILFILTEYYSVLDGFSKGEEPAFSHTKAHKGNERHTHTVPLSSVYSAMQRNSYKFHANSRYLNGMLVVSERRQLIHFFHSLLDLQPMLFHHQAILYSVFPASYSTYVLPPRIFIIRTLK